MKHIIMCIKAIKDNGKGNNINKLIFQFWRLYVRIRSHGGKDLYIFICTVHTYFY